MGYISRRRNKTNLQILNKQLDKSVKIEESKPVVQPLEQQNPKPAEEKKPFKTGKGIMISDIKPKMINTRILLTR